MGFRQFKWSASYSHSLVQCVNLTLGELCESAWAWLDCVNACSWDSEMYRSAYGCGYCTCIPIWPPGRECMWSCSCCVHPHVTLKSKVHMSVFKLRACACDPQVEGACDRVHATCMCMWPPGRGCMHVSVTGHAQRWSEGSWPRWALRARGFTANWWLKSLTLTIKKC